MTTTPFFPRTFSFKGCRTDEEARARLEEHLDEIDDEMVRNYGRICLRANRPSTTPNFRTASTSSVCRCGYGAMSIVRQDGIFRQMREFVRS